MDADLEQPECLGALLAVGGSSGNGRLRDLLGWAEPDYERVKAAQLASGLIKLGRGRGGSVALAGSAADQPPRTLPSLAPFSLDVTTTPSCTHTTARRRAKPLRPHLHRRP